MFWVIVSSVFAATIATTMIILRIKVAEKPTSKLRIILPPLFMSTGSWIFLFPVFRVDWLQAAEAIAVGMFFSLFLIRTSKLEVRNKEIYLIPSKAFIIILFSLLIVRTIGKIIIGSNISVGETGGIFYLLGFGMIVTWRLAMFYQYIQLEKKLHINYAPNK